MAEERAVEVINAWQTGILLVLGSLIVGVVLGGAVGRMTGQFSALAGVVGAILTFFGLSYLLYGR